MPYRMDSISYHLGVIFAFAEMVALKVKPLAFSLPFSPKDYRRLASQAKRIAKEQGVHVRLDRRILTTDLFPEEFTQGKWVLLIYKDPSVLAEYRRLKSEKRRLVAEKRYRGRARKGIALGLGRLLGYRISAIEEKLQKGVPS